MPSITRHSYSSFPTIFASKFSTQPWQWEESRDPCKTPTKLKKGKELQEEVENFAQYSRFHRIDQHLESVQDESREAFLSLPQNGRLRGYRVGCYEWMDFSWWRINQMKFAKLKAKLKLRKYFFQFFVFNFLIWKWCPKDNNKVFQFQRLSVDGRGVFI